MTSPALANAYMKNELAPASNDWHGVSGRGFAQKCEQEHYPENSLSGRILHARLLQCSSLPARGLHVVDKGAHSPSTATIRHTFRFFLRLFSFVQYLSTTRYASIALLCSSN